MKSLTVCAALAIAFSTATAATAVKDAHAGQPAHWSYGGHEGAGHWGDLQPEFATCKLGKVQSPIDIREATKADLPALGFTYAPAKAEIVNNGHTVQVNLAAGNSVKLASGDYQLLQFHFHTPSEEKIKGKAFPLVAHMVHKNATGELAVVAVLFKRGKKNAALAPLFAAMPTAAGGKAELAQPFDPASLLPSGRGYYAYMGSLTTPPCSEGVHWQVLRQPVELSRAQLAAFRKLYPMNARPVQPLNGRSLELSK